MQTERMERVLRAIDDIRSGRMVILVDDEDRENEGDLVLAAERVTPEAINFMRKFAGGLICLALTEERCDRLGLKPMASENRSPRSTAFTVSVEARRGVSTGISAADRAHTVRVAVARDAQPEDLVTPGHIFPLRARRGGVLVRSGHTEGSVDLARLAGLEPAGVICEIMNEDGSMARLPDLERFAELRGLRILTIADLIEYRLEQESLVERQVDTVLAPDLPGLPEGAEFRCTAYRALTEQTEYMALWLGDLRAPAPALVRVQTACVPGDVFGSRACDCGAQMRQALRMIAREGRGVFLYVYPVGRHSMLGDLDEHLLHQDVGRSGVSGRHMALRDFGLGAQVLAHLGLRQIRLATNNPKKIVGLQGFGLTVVERVPIEIPPTKQNITYLRDKRNREGHLLSSEHLAGETEKKS
ncbi:MAG TPA: 3,4-dihydroxy-2-butanone-4-phosphate synthase [Polyangia bacterium]|nr:3,4-dihydroxy-2-butanone-4-phosphate synthase [Polyangia bacterium]